MSTLKTNRIEQVSSTDLPVNLLPVTVSAWVNFNGTGVVAIRDSYNVSSITDVGVGNYTANLLTNLSNDNYSFAVGANVAQTFVTAISTSAVTIFTRNSSGTITDVSLASIALFGGQS